KDTRKSRGAVDDEKGVIADTVLSTNFANSKVIPQLRAGLDLGTQLPLPHSSLWLHNAIGIAHGERSDPYANFFFGGFGNNNVGAQADLRFTVLHWYEMTLSVGYAVGYKAGTRAGDEWIVSLKIM